MLNLRAIAVQGIGYAPRLVAVQGLWPFDGGGPGGFDFPYRNILRIRRRM